MKTLKSLFILAIFISNFKVDAQSLKIGDKAPELALKNPKQEILKLGSISY